MRKLKDLDHFITGKSKLEIGKNFFDCKAFYGAASAVVYVLNTIAKKNFKRFLKVNVDYAMLFNCSVREGQERIDATDNTYYSLYKKDKSGVPRLVLVGGKTINKTSKEKFRTITGRHINGSYVRLLISEEDLDLAGLLPMKKR